MKKTSFFKKIGNIAVNYLRDNPQVINDVFSKIGDMAEKQFNKNADTNSNVNDIEGDKHKIVKKYQHNDFDECKIVEEPQHNDNMFEYAPISIDPMETLNNLCSLYRDTVQIVETEKTKRTEIIACKDVKIEEIRAKRAMFQEFLQKTFDERTVNFNKLFMVIDDALMKNNIQELALGLDSLNKLAAQSPFKAFADIKELGKTLENKTEFDI